MIHSWARRQSLASIVLLVLCLTASAPAATPQQIDQAIDKAKKCLYTLQSADGLWNMNDDYFEKTSEHGGVTCLATYALLSTGESEKDPRLAKAIHFVVTSEFNSNYVLACQALALSRMESTPPVQSAIKKIAKKLLAAGERPCAALGLHFYDSSGRGEGYDHSNSQYGSLGVWACGDAGLEIPDIYWEDVEKGWTATREADGGWGYSKTDPKGSTASMTAAGVATMFVADDALSYRTGLDCKGNINNGIIEAGLKWLAQKMPPNNLYTWYGISRIGIASGYKYLGTFDWFKAGADALIKSQNADGYWPNNFVPAVSSSYGLLFLYRGRAPIVMNKLRHDKDPAAAAPIDADWNQRRRDAAGVATFIGDQLESFMNWQVVTLKTDPDELHDSPILYIAGSDPLKFTPEQEARLRKFIEDGGMILGNADCASTAFSESFKALCARLTNGKYEFRKLPPEHPIFTHQQFPAKKWKAQPVVEGLSNGVRELALLIPSADTSRSWHLKQYKTKREAFELIADIYLYSVDRQNIAEKGVTYIVEPDASTPAKTIKIARVQYNGNWDPEPGSWRRLAAIMHNTQKTALSVEPVTLGPGKLSGYQVAHLTGTAKFKLDDASRAEIKKFVEAGGTLIIDAAGGSDEFANTAQQEMTAIFGSAAAQLDSPVAAPSPVYGDMAAGDFHYRSYVREVDKEAPHGPMIRAIKFNNRPGVIFSPQDISAGLVGENVDGIIGYAPETAARLMSSLILAAVNPSPAPQPGANP